MIDVEGVIFTNIATKLREKYGAEFTVYGETVLAPSRFPCACIEESDNYPHIRSQDSSGIENHAQIVYEVNVFSNRRNGKKAECKDILATIDEYFASIGFTRNTKKPISLDDATKYRLFARYSAVASKNGIIYRR